MSTEVICAMIACFGAIFSALISFFVSRTTANKEIEKMELSWKREDIVSSDDEFAEMASAVARFVADSRSCNRLDAMSKVAAIRSREGGDISVYLDLLFKALNDQNPNRCSVFLSEVIEEKRGNHSETNAPSRNKPKKK